MSAALRAVWSNKILWVIHVIANAALLAAMWGWLWIPDRSVLHIMLSAVAAIAILVLLSWLHASTLEHFRTNQSVKTSFKPSFRRVVLFALWFVLLCAAMILVFQLKGYLQPVANWIASALTMSVRKPVTPASVSTVLSVLVAVLAFMVVPFLLLLFWNRNGRGMFLLSYVVIFLVCAYLPYRLVWWVPNAANLYGQSASLVARFAIAYLLAVTGWLVLAAIAGGGSFSLREKVARSAG